jgi:peptidylprolyl isomerase
VSGKLKLAAFWPNANMLEVVIAMLCFLKLGFYVVGLTVYLLYPLRGMIDVYNIEFREEIMWQELEIEDMIKGTGKTAERGALITAHYVGWLEDGTEFDSSYKKNTPFQTVLSTKRVIQGWILGLKDMQVGGKRRLRVPANLAYGERQIGSVGIANAIIPAHSNLIFEIELLEVLTRD